VLLVSAHRDNGPFSGALAGMASAILTLISIGAYPLWSGSLAVLTCWSSTAD